MTHTKGQWSINGPKVVGDGYNIAHVNSHATSEGNANARLIAASPKLLEAFEKAMWMIEGYEGTSDENDAIVDACRAAIAKARGDQ